MSMRSTSGRSLLSLAIAATAALGLVIADANARPGKGGSFGSRGDRTYTAPPITNTAPKTAAPIDKSMTQPGSIAKAPAATAGAATAGAAQAARGGLMRNLLLGGLIGAGLATLFGAGMLASVLGFVLQGALIVGLVMLAMALYRRFAGPRPATAAASAGYGQSGPQTNAAYRQAMAPGAGAGGAALTITADDYGAFERKLAEVQAAYGRADIDALGRVVTPELLSYFAGELDENRRNGVRNDLGAPKLLQGDLSEAWREAGGEYATVAMRYSLTDATVDVSTGRVVSGSQTTPDEVTELWTFRRGRGASADAWEVSAIQQA
jgi:predicted lipid-binding transport protein (Tim44 family)